MDKITVIMTTIPIRKGPLLKVVDSIYDQVDSIRIVFNGYKKIPSWVKSKSKIKAFLDASNKYTDCAKWKIVPEEGFVFSIDDDILYPKDYMPVLIKKLEEYDRKCVITVHGANLKLPFVDFRKNKKNYSCFRERKKDTRVHMVGSGTLAYHTDTIRPKFEDFLAPSRSDIWFSAICHRKKIPIICIARRRAWLKPIRTKGPVLWDLTKYNEDFRRKNTKYVKKYILPFLNKKDEIEKV